MLRIRLCIKDVLEGGFIKDGKAINKRMQIIYSNGIPVGTKEDEWQAEYKKAGSR